MNKTQTQDQGIKKTKALIDAFLKHHREISPQESFNLLREIIFSGGSPEDILLTQTKQLMEHTRAVHLPFAVGTFTTGNIFYRARIIEKDKEYFHDSDLWEAPQGHANRGRLNKKSESLLYMTDALEVAKREVGVKVHDRYLIVAYQNTKQIHLTEVGKKSPIRHSKAEHIKMEFISKIFRTPNEYIYEITELIAKKLFHLSEDGWTYPSIASKGKGKNVCLDTTSKWKLNIIGAFTFIACDAPTDVLELSIDTTGNEPFKNTSGSEAMTKLFQLKEKINFIPKPKERLEPINSNPIVMVGPA